MGQNKIQQVAPPADANRLFVTEAAQWDDSQ
jgi:hypothetical protein